MKESTFLLTYPSRQLPLMSHIPPFWPIEFQTSWGRLEVE
uniref:Uncharacterized protein n=1 Tax=Arundo donax TaxID=35708 RepID=A0A0A9G7A4_ARUDO